MTRYENTSILVNALHRFGCGSLSRFQRNDIGFQLSIPRTQKRPAGLALIRRHQLRLPANFLAAGRTGQLQLQDNDRRDQGSDQNAQRAPAFTTGQPQLTAEHQNDGQRHKRKNEIVPVPAFPLADLLVLFRSQVLGSHRISPE